MPWEFDIDLSEVEEAIAEADDELRRLPAVAVRAAAKEGLAESRARRRYKDRTGNLTATAYDRMLSATGTSAEAEIGFPMPYASYVDAGTNAHTIYPKLGGGVSGPLRSGQSRGGSGSGLLTFQIGGRWVSAREVHHPGTRPYAFAGDAYRKAESVLLREAEESVAIVQKILGR